MKLRLPHTFQAALMAALASVSFTTLSTGTLGAAFFVSGQAFAEDTEEDPSATIDIGDTNLDAQAAMEEEEGTAEKEPGSAPINEAGFNGGPGNNAGLLITESVDIDETELDTVVSSEPVAATSGSADSTPSDNLGFTSNPYASDSDTSNGSDDFSLTGTAPAAAYVPGQSGISAEEGDSAAGTGSGSSTNKTTTGGIGSMGGTGSGATGGRVARPMALAAPNMLSPVSSPSVDSGSFSSGTSGASFSNGSTPTSGDAAAIDGFIVEQPLIDWTADAFGFGNPISTSITQGNNSLTFTKDGTSKYLVNWELEYVYTQANANGATISLNNNSTSANNHLSALIQTVDNKKVLYIGYGTNQTKSTEYITLDMSSGTSQVLTMAYDASTDMLSISDASKTITFLCSEYGENETLLRSGFVRFFTNTAGDKMTVYSVSGQYGDNPTTVTTEDGTQHVYTNAQILTSGRVDALHSDNGKDAFIVNGNAELWLAATGNDPAAVNIASDIYLKGNYTGDNFGLARLDTTTGKTLNLNGDVVLGSNVVISSDSEGNNDRGTIAFNRTVDGQGKSLQINVPRFNGSTVQFNGEVKNLSAFTSASDTVFGTNSVASLGAVTFTTANRTLTVNGQVTVDSGTINNLAGSGTLTKASSDTLTLGATTNDCAVAVNVTGGTLELTSSVNTGAFSMSGGTLKLANGVTFTSSGAISLTGGMLDLRSVTLSQGTYTLATSTTGNINYTGVDFTLAGGYDKSQYILGTTGNALTLTFNDTPVPPQESFAQKYGTTLGTVQFVGDSITHGSDKGGTHNGASYRWPMHKIWTDAGVAYDENGYHVGNHSGNGYVPVFPGGSTYGGEDWDNRHSAQASGRAWQLIQGHSQYSGNTPASLVANYPSDVFFLMIGTNDTLSDYTNKGGVGAGNNPAEIYNIMMGYDVSLKTFSGTSRMDTIVDTFAENGGKDSSVVVLSIPTWSPNHGNNNKAEDFATMKRYNEILQEWCKLQGDNVYFVDVNLGIVDVANTDKPFSGVPSMFNDNLHPSGQGDLIFAGNIARQLGYAGRSVGLDRAAVGTSGTQWSSAASTSITVTAGAAAQTVEGSADAFSSAFGYTVDFGAVYGDGEANGWDGAWNTSNINGLRVQVGDGTHTGTLTFSEAYVKWGDTVLYSRDNHVAGENFRIAYINDALNPDDHVSAGYYVWLGDMLIGEGLAATSTGSGLLNGIQLSATGVNGTVTNLTWSDKAYAPTTTLYENQADAFKLVQVTPMPSHDNPTKQGIETITWTTTTDKYALPKGQTSTGQTLYKELSSTVGDAFTGAANAAYAGHIGMHYVGDSDLQINQSVISVLNVTVEGNVYMQFDNAATVYKSFAKQSGQTSVVASYGGGITGTYTAVYNAGIYEYAVLGGTYQNHTIGNGSYSYVNGGTFKGGVYGGGEDGTITGGTHVTVTGGKITGGVYGGGRKGGTINGGTLVTITGGYITGGVHGGGAAGTVNGGTAVVIDGNLAYIEGDISADAVTLQNVERNKDGYTDGFDYYAGTITGNNSITLSNYTVADMDAKLVTQSLVATGGTHTTIHDLTLTACDITVDADNTLTLADSLVLGDTATYTGDLALADGLVIDMSAAGGGGAYSDGENGFREGGNITVMQRGDSGALTVDTTKLTGAGTLVGSTFNYNETTGALTAAVSGEPGTYFVNTGTVVYGGPRSATDITTATKVQMQPTVGATLELAQNLTTDCTAGIVVTSSAVNPVVKIDKFESDGETRIVLAQSQLTANGDVKLAGNGTFALDTNSFALPQHVSLDDSWTGAVRVSTSQEKSGFDISTLSNGNSWVEFNGVSGWTTNWAGTNTQNIMLSDPENGVAWYCAANTTKTDKVYTATYTGKFAGDGTFRVNPDKLGYTFTGDVSAWTGKFLNDDDTPGHTSTLTFEGAANTINAAIENTGNQMKLVVNNNATFNRNVTGISAGLTVANGHHATFNGTTGISGASSIGGTVYNDGAMTLGGTIAVDMSDKTAFELYTGSDTTNTFDGVEAEGSGFLTSGDAQYYLIKTGAGHSLDYTGSGSSVSLKDNSLVYTCTADTSIYYVNSDLNYASRMSPASKIQIAGDKTLTIADESGVSASLNKVVGPGTANVTENASLSTGYATQGTGTLAISGVTLSLGSAEGNTVDISSFSKLVLEDGIIKQQMKAGTYNNVTVNSAKTGEIASIDMDTNTHILAGDTTVDGTLILANWWNAQFEIESMVGNGTLAIRGTQSKDSVLPGTAPQQNMVLTIDSLSSGNEKFTGQIDINHKAKGNQSDERYAIHSGNQAVSFASLSTDVLTQASVTFTAEAASTIGYVNIVADNSTLTVNGNADTTVTTLTGAGDLKKEGSGSLVLGSTDSFTGDVTVNAGTLELTSAVDTISGALTMASGTTLKLAEFGDADAVTVGSLSLAGNSILDLRSLNIAGTEQSITLMKGGTIDDSSLGSVQLVFAQGVQPTGYELSKSGNNLVLTFAPVDNSLIWDAHTNNIWTNNGAGNWHVAGAEAGSSVFAANDDVTFEGGTHTVSLGESVAAGTMTVAAGENLTITDNSHNISATSVSIGGTLNANSGALNASTPVTIAENGKWVVSDTIPTADTAKAMNVTVQEGGELHIKGGSGNGSWIDLPDDSGSGKVVLDSGRISYLSDLGGNTLVLSSGTALRFGSAQGTGGHDYAGDIELIGNANLSTWGSSQHPGGVTLSGDISGADYTLTRDDGDRLVEFKGNVDLGGFTNNASAAKFSGENTRIGSLTTNQATEFTGNATVNTLSSSGNLVKSGADTTLTLGGTDNYTGAVTVNSGTLALTDSMTLGAVTVANAGILQLAGNDEMLTTTGAFTLASGSTLDLSNYTFSGTETVTLVTTSGSGSIVAPGDWSSVNLVFNGEAPENAALSVENNNLVLTFAPSADLIWDNNTSDSSWTSSHNWHEAEAELGSSVFKNGDSVSFTSATPNAAPTLGADVTADTMSIATGETVTVEGAHVLTVTSLAGAGANLVMNGSSLTVTDGGSSTVGKVTEHSGTMNVANTGTAQGSNLFNGDLQVDGGSTLNLTPAGHATTIADTEGAKINGQVIIGTGEGTAEIKVTNQSSVTLTQGLRFAEDAASAKFTITGDRNQYVNGLYGSGVTLNIERTSASGASSRAGYFVVSNLSKDEFSGTINLHTIPGTSGRQNGGMIVYNSPEGLANTVINFGTADSNSALAFLENRNKGTWDGDYQDNWSRSLKGGTFQNALLGGLDGTKGKVWANDLTINTATGVSTAFGGELAINSLIKAGDGTQALNAANTYTGGTTVNGGTLLVSNVNGLGTGAVNVASGATLQFNSSLASSAQTGAITLAAGTESLAGGTLTFAGVDANALNVTGALMLGSGSVLNVREALADFAAERGEHYTVTLAQTTSGITGELGDVLVVGQGGFAYALDRDKTDTNKLVVTFVDNRTDLVWNGRDDKVWAGETTETDEHTNWHTANNVYKSRGFHDYDSVSFTSNATATLGADVVSGDLSIVGLSRTVTVKAADHDFTVDGAISGHTASLTVSNAEGTKNSRVEVAGAVDLQNMTLTKADTTLKGHVQVTGTLSAAGGRLTLEQSVQAGTLAVSTVAAEIKGEAIIDTMNATGSTVTLDSASTVKGITLAGSTLTNNGAMDMKGGTISVSGTSMINGSGSMKTGGIAMASETSLTLNGGQDVNILSGAGISGGGELHLGNATLRAEASAWSIDASITSVELADSVSGTTFRSSGYTLTVDAKLSGNGKLVKEGAGTLRLNGANTYTGNTLVNAGTLVIGGAGSLTSAVTVANGARLALAGDLAASATLGDVTLNSGATLRLSGEDELSLTGTLNFGSGSTLDLSNINIVEGRTEPYVLASANSFAGDLNQVTLTMGHGIHPAEGTTPSLTIQNGKLLLSYTANVPRGLIWDGGTAVWNTEGVQHWHAEGSSGTGTTAFEKYDNVIFENPTGVVEPSVANVSGDVWATGMTVKAGTDASNLNTVTINTATAQDSLRVDFLNAEVNTAIVKTGAGSAAIGIANPAHSADLTVQGGSLEVMYVDIEGKGMTVTNDLVRDGGDLDLVVGREGTPTNVTFGEGSRIIDPRSITVLQNSTLNIAGTFNESINNAVFHVEEGAVINVLSGATMSLSSHNWDFSGSGAVNMMTNVTWFQADNAFHEIKDTVDVYIQKATFTSNNSTTYVDDGASLSFGEFEFGKNGQQRFFHAFEQSSRGERQMVNIDTVTISTTGDKYIGAIQSNIVPANYQQPGDFDVTTLNGSGTFVLCNYAPQKGGWDEPEVLYLGGRDDSNFSGTIRLFIQNAGTDSARKDAVLVLRDETVAQSALIEIYNNNANNADFGIGIAADNVKVQGIYDAAGKELKSSNKAVVFSGSIAREVGSTYQSDDIVRTLEITGKSTDTAETVYTTGAGVDKNLNIVKKGVGTQVFSGDSSKFNASIEVQEGVLEFSNTASLYIEDLTLGKDKVQQPALMKSAPLKALGSDAANVDTLAVRTDAAGENVGMAEVNGTLKAKSGAALDSNLTLASGSKLDVRDTLSAKTNPEMTDKTDYVGGLNMLDHSITLQGGASLSDADRSALLSMQWGERYELAYNLSSLTLGSTTYTTDSIEFIREDYLNKNIEASKYFENLQEANYYICYSGSGSAGPGGNVGTLYIFKAPEPTTSTLSLLALAALAARRRRK